MSDLQLIEELCAQIEQQNEIIKRLSFRLAQVTELSEEEKTELTSANNSLKELIGDALI